MPSVALLAKKLWLRILDYIKEVFPLIAAGVLMIHILDALHIITAVSQLLGKPITFLLGLPHDIAPVMILGFLRKDVSIALLAPFNLSATQFIVASIFMVLYIPCIASFFTLVKELGVLSATKVIGVVFVTALAVSTALHGVFVIAHKLHL
jgi:ferrous iron transport protein B